MSVKPSVRDFEASPMTLRELQEALADLRSGERNYGESTEMGRLCADTHAVLEALAHEYLRSDPA